MRSGRGGDPLENFLAIRQPEPGAILINTSGNHHYPRNPRLKGKDLAIASRVQLNPAIVRRVKQTLSRLNSLSTEEKVAKFISDTPRHVPNYSLLYDQTTTQSEISTMLVASLTEASTRGSLALGDDIVELCTQDDDPEMKKEVDEFYGTFFNKTNRDNWIDLFRAAIANGNISFVHWILQKYHKEQGFEDDWIYHACLSKEMFMIRWLVENYPTYFQLNVYDLKDIFGNRGATTVWNNFVKREVHIGGVPVYENSSVDSFIGISPVITLQMPEPPSYPYHPAMTNWLFHEYYMDIVKNLKEAVGALEFDWKSIGIDIEKDYPLR